MLLSNRTCKKQQCIKTKANSKNHWDAIILRSDHFTAHFRLQYYSRGSSNTKFSLDILNDGVRVACGWLRSCRLKALTRFSTQIDDRMVQTCFINLYRPTRLDHSLQNTSINVIGHSKKIALIHTKKWDKNSIVLRKNVGSLTAVVKCSITYVVR